MELTMFQRLQELPLLQGLNMENMSDIVSKVRLDFQQMVEEDTIALQMTQCRRLVFILKGTVRIEYIDPQNRFRFTEYAEAPFVVEPHNMFGMNQKYQRTYICQTPCQTLTIERTQFLNVLMNYSIIKTNTLNLICNTLQRTTQKLINVDHTDAQSKFVQLIHTYSTNPHGKKNIIITMDTLAEMFCETRLNVSRMLKAYKEKGIITQERKSFTIIELDNL